MSGDPEQEYFADGMVEDIITALSRVRWFFVIARNSSFTYKGKAVDIRQVGRELGVRYVLEGSIRKAGNRVRISGQLVEAATGRHVWADRFDGDLADIFDLQDQITEAVVGAIEPSLRAAEVERARSKPTDNLDAYDLYLRALPHFYGMSKDGFTEALALCDRARVLDPSFALAKALASFARAVRLSYDTGDPGEHELAVQLAREVVRSGTDDPEALRRAAHVLGYIDRAYEESLGAITRSLELNQNSAGSHGSAGWIRLYVDEPLLAEDHFRRALRLSPVDPEKVHSTSGLAVSFAMRGQRDLALEYARRSVREMPQYPTGNKALIHALVMSGLEEEARAAARRFLGVSPTFTLTHQRTVTPFRNQAFCAEYLDALKRAGIPE
jgi:adenylate cyclase